jgi:hypothetical protein
MAAAALASTFQVDFGEVAMQAAIQGVVSLSAKRAASEAEAGNKPS